MHIKPIFRNVDADNDGVHPDPILAQAGFAERPKRLFGFDGTAGEDPCSPTGLASQRGSVSRQPPHRLLCQKRRYSSYKGAMVADYRRGK